MSDAADNPLSRRPRAWGPNYRFLTCGRHYTVIREFLDYDGVHHPAGETWLFLGHRYLPYEDGLSLFVSPDGRSERHIRLQCRPGEQLEMVDRLERYLAADSSRPERVELAAAEAGEPRGGGALRKVFLVLMAVALATVLAVIGYRKAMPEIAVENQTPLRIVEVVVEMPAGRIVFSAVAPKGEAAVHHSAARRPGDYAYRIRFADGTELSGRCGRVDQSGYGKRLRLVVLAGLAGPQVSCRESNKLF